MSMETSELDVPLAPHRRLKPQEARWVTWVTWIAILAPLPYAVSRLLWAAGVPVGIEEWLLHDLHAPGWGSVYIAVLVLLSEGTGVFTHRYVLARRRTVPARIPGLGGRALGRRAVIGVLAMPIAILALANVTTVPAMLDGFTIPADNAGLPGWSFWGQIATFWVWGLSLAVATFAYWRSTRPGDPAAVPAGRGTRWDQDARPPAGAVDLYASHRSIAALGHVG